jgi:competence protein ComEC
MLVWRHRQSVHTSWLVAAACFGAVIGLITSPFVSAEVPIALGVSSSIVLLAVGLRKKKLYSIVLMLAAGILAGIVRGDSYQRQLEPYAAVLHQVVMVRGKVIDDSDIGKGGETVLRLGDIVIRDYPIGGAVWVSAAGDAIIKRGDYVTVKGRLDEGFGSFAASMYRAEIIRIERPMPGSIALRARDTFAGGVRQAISEPEASLGVGFVVGQRRSLPEELDTALRATGLTHVVVASGYNLTILVGLARRLFVKLSKFLAAFFSSAMIIAFVAVTGMSPSMSRAGLVTGMSLIAWYYGRRFHPLVLLPMAAAITLFINPAYARNDLGWQLSFAAFAGVLVVGPLLQNYFYGKAKPSLIRQLLFETMSAWVCTMPLIALAFGQFSNIAILANMLVLPLVPLAMLLTFVAGSVAFVLPGVASLVGLPASFLLGYMTKVTTYLGSVSWAQTEIALTPLAVTAYYAVLVGICGYAWWKTQFKFMEQTIES